MSALEDNAERINKYNYDEENVAHEHDLCKRNRFNQFQMFVVKSAYLLQTKHWKLS